MQSPYSSAGQSAIAAIRQDTSRLLHAPALAPTASFPVPSLFPPAHPVHPFGHGLDSPSPGPSALWQALAAVLGRERYFEVEQRIKYSRHNYPHRSKHNIKPPSNRPSSSPPFPPLYSLSHPSNPPTPSHTPPTPLIPLYTFPTLGGGHPRHRHPRCSPSWSRGGGGGYQR